MDSTTQVDALVVGGGLVGCMIARALASAGLSVKLLEREAVGAGASHDAAGMIAPQGELADGGPFLDLCVESAHLYPLLAEELFAETGVDVRYRQDGTFAVAFDEHEAERLKRVAGVHSGLGLKAELLGATAARRLEPALSDRVAAVLSIPDDHQVDNRRLTFAVATSCRQRGVEVVEHAAATRLARDASGRVVGVETDRGTYEASVTVVAAGCWSSQIEGFNVPVEPVKGQMLALDLVAPPFARVLRSERCYLVSRIDGRILIGSTMERVGFEQSVSVQTVSRLLAAAWELVPSLSVAVAGEAWAGLRPATPDGLPAIGPLEEGLVAATGHFRNGILLAPVTAKLVADVVLSKPAHPALTLLDPKRFLTAPVEA
jgi:glycine oxidase